LIFVGFVRSVSPDPAVLNRANCCVGAQAGAFTRVLPSRIIVGLTENIEPRLGRHLRLGIIVRSRRDDTRARARTHTHTHTHTILTRTWGLGPWDVGFHCGLAAHHPVLHELHRRTQSRVCLRVRVCARTTIQLRRTRSSRNGLLGTCERYGFVRCGFVRYRPGVSLGIVCSRRGGNVARLRLARLE
jgi:hypothetical protein